MYQYSCYTKGDAVTNWNTDGGSLAAFLIPGVIVPAALLVSAFWQPTRRQVLRWGTVCDVTITDANEGRVRSHLGRVRRFRSVAAFPFWWLIGIRLVYADFPEAWSSPLPAIAAYVGGALLAELTSAPLSAPGTVRRATLLARSTSDYLPRWTRLLPWSLIGVGAAALIVGSLLRSTGSTVQASVVVVLAAAFAGFAELVSRALVRLPQRGDDLEVLAADDGLRAAGASTAEAGASLAGVAAAWTGIQAAAPATGGWWLLLFPVWLVLSGLTVGLLCCIVRQETWGYRRRHHQPAIQVVPA